MIEPACANSSVLAPASPRAQRMLKPLQKLFKPLHLQLIDDSHLHSRGLESHFRLLIVSSYFKGLSSLQRQQQVLKALSDEFQNGLCSLSQKALTPEEWQKTYHGSPAKPPQASKCFHRKNP